MATHSSVLAWRIPGTGEPSRLPSMRSHRVGHDWSDLAAAAAFGDSRGKIQRRQWHPTPVLLSGKSHGWRSLVGCSPWGHEESDRTEQLHFDFSLSCIGEGSGNPLQCSCLENPRDGGAWWAAVYGVTQSRTRLKWLSRGKIRPFLARDRKVLVAQSCPTLCDSMGSSPQSSSVCGFLQARILKWAAMPFSKR